MDVIPFETSLAPDAIDNIIAVCEEVCVTVLIKSMKAPIKNDTSDEYDEEYDNELWQDAMKPQKRKMPDMSSESDSYNDDESYDESVEQDEPTYQNMELLSKKLDQEKEKAHNQLMYEYKDELKEAATLLSNELVRELESEIEPTPKKSEAFIALDMTALKQRIQTLLSILSDFNSLRDPNLSREQYVKYLSRYLSIYYGYSEYLLLKFYDIFPIGELIEFLESNETQRPVTIRTNTLKTKRKDLAQMLRNRGFNVESMPEQWSKVGLQVFDSSLPIGATPEYLAGYYMLQSMASFLPVLALQSNPNERILDMCAAPGGKASHIAAHMKNTGCLFVNDVSEDRMKACMANLHRMGVTNAIMTNLDGRQFPHYMGGFDRVLLDAPCSGTGVISKDPSVKASKTGPDFKLLTHLQKELVLSAIDSVDASSDASIIVYSTCSVNVEENEEIIQYALTKRPNVKLVPTGLEFGREGLKQYRDRTFHSSMSLTKRFYPHVHNLDGFFVAKLKKTSNKFVINSKERIPRQTFKIKKKKKE